MTTALTSPSCEFVRRFRHDEKLWSGRFSADGARIFIEDRTFANGEDGFANQGYIWDIATGDMLYGGSVDARHGCAANCDYYIPAITADDSTQRIYKVGSARPILEFEGRAWFDGSPDLVVLNLEPHNLANGVVLYKRRQLYNFKNCEIICDLDFISATRNITGLSDNGAHLLCTTEKANEMAVWDIKARECIARLAPSSTHSIKGHLDGIETALFVPGQNNRVMTITRPRVYSDGLDPMAAIIWDVATSQPTAQIFCGGDRTLQSDPHSNACDIHHRYAFADNGTWFAALRADGYTGPTESMMRVFRTHSGDEVAQFEIAPMPHNIAGAPNAPFVAATSFESPLVRIFEIGSNHEIAHCAAPEFISDTPAMNVAFAPSSPDGQYVLTTHEGGDAVLWRMPHWV